MNQHHDITHVETIVLCHFYFRKVSKGGYRIMPNNYGSQINKLITKAEQNRQMHFAISRSKNRLHRLLHSLVLIGSSITAILAFSDYTTFQPWVSTITDVHYKLSIGVFAGLVFITSILEEFLRLEEVSISHEFTGKKLTTFIRSASSITSKEVITKEDLDFIINNYNNIHENAPLIPDRIFLREKQRFRMKLSISKQLGMTPFMNIKLFKWKMKLRQLKRDWRRSKK